MNAVSIDRKPIFNAVRIMLGRGFSQSEVQMIDRAIDRAMGGETSSGDREFRLGSISQRFESGGRGPGTVSGGAGDPGGVSYGIYQLASKTGSVDSFVSQEGLRWSAEFGGHRPGTAKFSSEWKTIARREPESFCEAQHRFVERTHYRPAVEQVKIAKGLDLDSRHRAVREAVWSVAVQHGGAARILMDAVDRADVGADRGDPDYDLKLVKAIYEVRTHYVERIAQRLRGAARRMLDAVARKRYPAELKEVLALF